MRILRFESRKITAKFSNTEFGATDVIDPHDEVSSIGAGLLRGMWRPLN